MNNKFEVIHNQAQVENLGEVLARPEELLEVPSFRIASYNMHNLFGDRPDVHSGQPGPPASPEQLKALAKMIVDLDADAIAFQEVQNERALSDLIRKRVNPKLEKEARFTTFICIPSHDPRGINVALATRLAVNGTMNFNAREFGPLDARAKKFSRDLLGVDMYATPSYRFIFFVAHLKSKLGGEESEYKRSLEAEEIRAIIEKPTFGGHPFIQQDMILAGDMNDDPDKTTIDILRGADPAILKDVLADVEPNYTYPTHTRYPKTRLDYMFASPSVKISEAKIHRENAAAAAASDHYPVSATIKVPRPRG
jgi:endonuclease/exonuclease/phosphatase family metal-dependent hydrolase